jgi:very-short-patch-repair endonuclease
MLKDVAPKARPGATARARKLRRQMTLPEVMLWATLRTRPAGLKFRRQHPSGVYILDFYCGDARLAVEVDGEAHSRGDQPIRDEHRDEWLQRADVETLRVPASEILRNIDAVVNGIVARARARLPLHHPAAPVGPPPRDKLGEEL